jgi:hypothetical protein
MTTFIFFGVVYLLLSDICRTVQEKKRLRPKEEGEAKRINTPMVSKQ